MSGAQTAAIFPRCTKRDSAVRRPAIYLCAAIEFKQRANRSLFPCGLIFLRACKVARCGFDCIDIHGEYQEKSYTIYG